MENLILKQLWVILPEIALVLLAIFSQVLAVFSRNHRLITALTIILITLLLFLVPEASDKLENAFGNTFVANSFTSTFKILMLVFTILALIAYYEFCKIAGQELKMEFVVLVLLSAVGALIAISSRNFLLLFSGLELQALAGYALAGFSSSDAQSSEAGLKYFVLGALVSCISLFGMSFIYGYSGSLQFSDALAALILSKGLNVGLVIGIILMLSAIFFKLSAAPLHVWTPDVYEGAPTVAVMYFSTAQKIAVLAVLMTLLTYVTDNYRPITVSLVKILAIFSMIIGALGAIRQQSLKRLMGYSAVLNVGYVLIGIALNNDEGKHAAILYMLIYTTAVAGFFACLIAAAGYRADRATFEDIKGISYNKKTLAAAISIIMFSMIGVPPLAGFFGKYYLFYQALMRGEFTLAIVGIGTSVIAAFYYLKVVMYMYFSEPKDSTERIPTHFGLMLVTLLVLGIILFFSFLPADYLKLIMITP